MGKSAPNSFSDEKCEFLPGLLVNLHCFSGINASQNFQNQISSFPVIDCDSVCLIPEIFCLEKSGRNLILGLKSE